MCKPTELRDGLQDGWFVRRLNRFVCLVDVGNGQPIPVHVPSSGRMEELLVPDAQVIIQPFPENGKYKTKGRLERVLYVGQSSSWVSVDSHLPNRLFAEAFRRESLSEFKPYGKLDAEVAFGDSRLDFLWQKEDRQALIEVKSVTLVENGIALFPDAPTMRGTRHVKTLMRGIAEGYLAYLVFIIQREDAIQFSPHGVRDPAFAEAVGEAMATGVEVLAYDCTVTPNEVALRGLVPVVLEARD
ncbi:MAG: DNA/RNA nuclease SfsA [Firmicutes bacterium]|nr:DNA/RNA nuclease SfsA [Bacillota bacterium]